MGKATPNAEQRRLVALWRASAFSMSAFARSHGVLPGTFASWVARHGRPLVAAPASCSFIEVTTVPEDELAPMFVVRVDDQALGFDAPPPPAWFAAVLRELRSC